MDNGRKHHTPEEKVATLGRRLLKLEDDQLQQRRCFALAPHGAGGHAALPATQQMVPHCDGTHASAHSYTRSRGLWWRVTIGVQSSRWSSPPNYSHPLLPQSEQPMPTRHSFGEIHLDVTAGREQPQVTPDPETPFRIAILGDFSGRANRGLSESGDALASRRPLMIDRDNFDSVLAKIAPRLELAPGGEDGFRISLKFGDLDDFHPDRLFEKVQIFQKLRETRQKLNDPATFAKTASELGLVGKQPSAQKAPQAAAQQVSPADIQRVVSGSLLDEMVEATEGRAAEEYPSKRPDEWTTLLNKIVAPHVVAKADPRQAELVALIDKATSAQMAALLHAPDFQALEAAWRAVFFLVRNIETDPQLKLFLIDVSKQELAEDLLASGDLSSTGIYKLLVEKTVGTPGAEPWAVIAGNFTFGPTLEDAELLARIAKVAAGAGAPFIAGASPRLLGCDSALDLPDPRQWKSQMSGGDRRFLAIIEELARSSLCWLGASSLSFAAALWEGYRTR